MEGRNKKRKKRKKEKVRKENLFWKALYIYEQSSMLTILLWGALNIIKEVVYAYHIILRSTVYL